MVRSVQSFTVRAQKPSQCPQRKQVGYTDKLPLPRIYSQLNKKIYLPGVLPATRGDSDSFLHHSTLSWSLLRGTQSCNPVSCTYVVVLRALARICPSQTSTCNSTKAEDPHTTSLLSRVSERMGVPGPSLLCLCWTPNLCWGLLRACRAMSPHFLWCDCWSTGFLPIPTLEWELPLAAFSRHSAA